MKDNRSLQEIMDDTKDFQKTLDMLTDKEKERVKIFALGLMAGSEAAKRTALPTFESLF